MLRFPFSTLSLTTKKFSKIPFLYQRLNQNFKTFNYFFSTAEIKNSFNQLFLSGKYYQVLGYGPETNISSLSDNEIKKQYLAMVKKYHSDGVTDPQQKVENEQITKCIIAAFDKLSSQRVQNKINAGIYDKIYQNQDEIAMKIYGKKFDQIKYELFREGNGQKRAEFMEQLERIRKESPNYQYQPPKKNPTSTQSSYSNYSSSTNSSGSRASSQSSNIWMIIGGAVVLGIYLIYDQSKKNSQAEIQRAQRKSQKMTLGQQKIKQIEKKSMQLHDKKLNDMIQSFTEEMPPTLKYSNTQDPDQLEQLIQYTIGPDINLYEIPSALMAKKDNLEKLNKIKNIQEIKNINIGQNIEPFPLTKIKVNSFISLSLQAERCLQNIYIRVKDVADQIQQTGKYTPPKILFRFFGYIMFDIRQKPLSLQNYRDTQYVSLFDLFFDYYSPIPVKRHEYNEYLVGFNDHDEKMYGQVHLNHRKIPERFISKDDKVVVMKDDISDIQYKYAEIWDHFYAKYMRIWKRDNPGRISTEHM